MDKLREVYTHPFRLVDSASNREQTGNAGDAPKDTDQHSVVMIGKPDEGEAERVRDERDDTIQIPHRFIVMMRPKHADSQPDHIQPTGIEEHRLLIPFLVFIKEKRDGSEDEEDELYMQVHRRTEDNRTEHEHDTDRL